MGHHVGENWASWAHSRFTSLSSDSLPQSAKSSYSSSGRSLKKDSSTVEELAVSFAEKVVRTVLRVGLFLLSFILILILWHILAHTLDLVSRLPVLNTMNKLGGFLLGAVRGALFLFVVAWILKYYPSVLDGLILPETVEQTCLLKFFLTVNPMELLAAL